MTPRSFIIAFVSFVLGALLVKILFLQDKPFVAPVQNDPSAPVILSSPPEESSSSSHAGWGIYADNQLKFEFKYPPTAAEKFQKDFPEDVVEINLGETATPSTNEQTVPKAMLRVLAIPSNDSRIKNCFFSDQGWQQRQPTGTKTTIDGHEFCISKESDAGAGNFYNSTIYTVKHGQGYLVFLFVVHSLNCMNFPDPATQCLPFNEARDTAQFKGIIETFRGL